MTCAWVRCVRLRTTARNVSANAARMCRGGLVLPRDLLLWVGLLIYWFFFRRSLVNGGFHEDQHCRNQIACLRLCTSAKVRVSSKALIQKLPTSRAIVLPILRPVGRVLFAARRAAEKQKRTCVVGWKL